MLAHRVDPSVAGRKPIPCSPKMILVAKSGIRAIHAWWTVENLVFQHTGSRKNDFASSIKNDDDPGCCGELWASAELGASAVPGVTSGERPARLARRRSSCCANTWQIRAQTANHGRGPHAQRRKNIEGSVFVHGMHLVGTV